METNLFRRHELLKQKGIVIGVVPHNQIVNGFEKQVQEGTMPLITFTVEVMDEQLSDMLYTVSCDSFGDALREGVEFAEQNLIKTEK